MQIGTQGIIQVLFLDQPPHLERQGHIDGHFGGVEPSGVPHVAVIDLQIHFGAVPHPVPFHIPMLGLVIDKQVAVSPSTPLAFQMLDDGPHEMFAIHHPVKMIDVVHLDGARPVCRKRIRVVRLDGTALGPLSLLPHPALSGGLERQTSHSLCTPPHPRFTLYSRPPRTSPSGSRPGKGYQRISCKSSNNPTRR